MRTINKETENILSEETNEFKTILNRIMCEYEL